MIRPKTDPPRGILRGTPANPGTRRYVRYHASPDLDRYVEHFWLVEWDLRGSPPERAETLPHPAVHLVFEAGGRSRVGGPARARFTTQLCGKGGVFAVKFRPGGFRPFVSVPVSTLADRKVRVGEVFGPEGEELERAVLAETDDAARVALVEAFLRGRRPEPDGRVDRVAEIVGAAARDLGIVKVRDLAARFRTNARALERLFAEYVGVSPKWVIQRYRLHEAAARLAIGEPVRMSDLALELGYGDQAHFVRDFKATVGTSPAAYARAARTARKP